MSRRLCAGDLRHADPARPNRAALATPEKALLDYLYLRPARSNLFCALPELELPAKFNVQSARQMIQRIPSIRRRTLVARSLDELPPLAASSRHP